MYCSHYAQVLRFECVKPSVGKEDLHAKDAEDFFEQVCMEDFNTKEDVILWKQVLNEVRRSTLFFQDAPDILPFDQTNIKMHLMAHCKVSAKTVHYYGFTK